MVMSSRFPIGVATRYKPGFKAPCLEDSDWECPVEQKEVARLRRGAQSIRQGTDAERRAEV